MAQSHRYLVGLVCLPVVIIGLNVRLDAGGPPNAVALQQVVDGLKTQLRIDAAVEAAIVPTNSLLVSVRQVEGLAGTFRIEFEERFLTTVDEDELKAIVAHELGHVWIFTHHPYLQTEQLANTVAMRVVPRTSLERVYSLVWERQGTKGDLARFLSPE